MATLLENINQAISDFDGIKAAIEESGVSVPYDTNTSEYGNLVRKAVLLGGGGDAGPLILALQEDVTTLQQQVALLDEGKANAADVYTKTETDALLSGLELGGGITAEQFAALTETVEEISATYITKEEAYQIANTGDVDVNRLVQSADDELVLCGGSSI